MTKHHVNSIVDYGYTGPVSRDENPAAHGNVCEVQSCICGATRRININGWHREEGEWDLPHQRINAQAIAATPAMCRRYLVDAARSATGRQLITALLGDSASAVLDHPDRGDDTSTVQLARLLHARLG